MHYLLPASSLTQRFRTFAILVFIMVCAGQCQSQFRPPEVAFTDQDTVRYSFFNQEENLIENEAYLEPLLQQLYVQRTRGGKKINIVHIGDSHILGNYMTNEVRHHLQNAFGNGGRGLIFPYKFAGSNGPRDYKITTDTRWSGSNCQRNLAKKTPYGISGFMAESKKKNGKLSVHLRDTSTAQTRLFTKITVFYRSDDGPVNFTVRDEVTNQDAVLFLKDDFFKSYYFDQPVAQASINFEADKKKGGNFVLDGILLENEFAGIIYHSIGVNGGKFSDFVRARFFARQLADLNPDLIILSFGTNEAQGKVNANYIYKQMETLVTDLQKYAPNAHFLFTTPADSYLKGRGYNPYMPKISTVIRQFALDNNYALWDLFGLAGGARSAQSWKSTRLLSSDSVHYSKAGYTVQGKLFYQSLIRSYNNYVQKIGED